MAPIYPESQVNGFVLDDNGELDFTDLEQEYAVPYEDGFDTVIVVDNCPIVEEDARKQKLILFIRKIFSTNGVIKEDGIYMPMKEDEETGKLKSQGYVFIEYATPEQAAAAIKSKDGHALDRSHKLRVNRFADVEKYVNAPENYVEPEIEPYVQGEHLRSWLKDPQARDQFFLYRDTELSVCFNRKKEAPEVVTLRANWTENTSAWSPLGTYLTTFHQQGLQIWGGASWNRIQRFPHKLVRLINYSTNEKYLVTWSPAPITVENPELPFDESSEGHEICIWETQTGELLRTFPPVQAPEDQRPTWPFFKFSADEKYVARLHPGKQISVYELPSMRLLDNNSIKITGVRDFEWAPSRIPGEKKAGAEEQHMLCYWMPEQGNSPAKVALMNIPSKEVVRTKNLFNVSDCKLHWQSNSEFLCVKVDRHTKTKKTSFTNLEIFHVREKNIPVEVIEVKDTVIAFAWEPKGERFATIMTADAINPERGLAGLRTNVNFYMLEKAAKAAVINNFKLIRSIDKKQLNSIFWSPKGRFVALSNLGRGITQFDMEIYDCDYEGDNKDLNKELNANIMAIHTGESFGTTDVEWDPTGRYIATSSSFWKHPLENGYQIRDFKGTALFENHLERFKLFSWRPRPPTLVPKDQQRKIRRTLKDYSREFDAEDEAEAAGASQELLTLRRRLLEEWYTWRKAIERTLLSEKQDKKDDGVKDADEIIEEWVEEVVEEKEEVVRDE